MSLYMLVDGYNVINNWQILKEEAQKKLGRCAGQVNRYVG